MSVVELNAQTTAAGDPTGQFGEVVNLGEHMRDALWRVESAAGRGPVDTAGGLVVCGMGGSAIGADLAAAALGDRASRPIRVSRGYGLPAGTTPETTVLCATYSGATEETLAAYDAAGALGARRVVSTTGGALADQAREDGVPVIPLPGGFQPRAAVGYGLVVALEVAALCGAGPSAAYRDRSGGRARGPVGRLWGPDGAEDGQAKVLARTVQGTIPVIAGAGLTAPVAYRWKTQFNENAKYPAFASVLPELDHNEIVGWKRTLGMGRLSAVFLDDSPICIRGCGAGSR